MSKFQRLGWRFPRANTLRGPDADALKATFGDIQKLMTWPYVGLRFDGTFALTAALASPTWVAKSSAASPFVAGDPYKLYRSATKTIQVPQDFTTWMAIGSAGFLTNALAGTQTDVLTAAWRVNGTLGVFSSHMTGNPASRVSVPLMTPVRKGDTIDIVAASNNAAEDLTAAEAWVLFIPLV